MRPYRVPVDLPREPEVARAIDDDVPCQAWVRRFEEDAEQASTREAKLVSMSVPLVAIAVILAHILSR